MADYIKPIDMAGKRFGNLTVIELAEHHVYPSGSIALWWKCLCDCGNIKIVDGRNLRRGYIVSCGCHRRKGLHKTHGYAKHSGEERLYKVWKSMKQRCFNKKSKSYKYYGERGIAVCSEWEHNYLAFREWATKTGYDAIAQYGDCTIDRIDVDKGYSPDNCRWITLAEQQRNKRNNKHELYQA